MEVITARQTPDVDWWELANSIKYAAVVTGINLHCSTYG